MTEEYYTREKGYTFFILEEDGKTLREVDVHDWRKWGHKTSKGWTTEDVNGWYVSTWFFGEKHNEYLSLWVTSVFPKGCYSPHACAMDLKWDTYEEAEAGHNETVRKIEEGIYLQGERGDKYYNEQQKKIQKRAVDDQSDK